MGDPVLRSIFAARWAVVPLTALAMLLPLPASCFGCTTGAGACLHCGTEEHGDASLDGTATDGRGFMGCCQRHAPPDEAPAVVDCGQRSLPGCNCCARPVHRTLPTTEKLQSVLELVAALPLALLAPAVPPADALSLAPVGLADLPPPVPHRILHCSWLI